MRNDFRSKLPKSLYTAEQTRALDQCAIQVHGIPGLSLMERAGQACLDILLEQWPDCSTLAICCGSGNNAGDGYVIARLASAAGKKVVIYQIGDMSKLKGDALACAQRVSSLTVINIQERDDLERFRQGLNAADVVVDALLGTGLKGGVASPCAELIDAVNQSGKPVLAVDIPSGLSADTGAVLGCAIKASLTVTFIGLKRGLLSGLGPGLSGRIYFNDLAVPESVYETVPSTSCREDYASLATLLSSFLSPRQRTAHKGSFGHVLIVGGNYGMAGAALMAGMSAMRVGAGMVTVATRPEHCGVITSRQPELMVRGIAGLKDLQPLLEKATVVILGPGLGAGSSGGEWAQTLFNYLVQQDLPMVVDADGLNLLSRHVPKLRKQNRVLTPHPGEAGRLLACSAEKIESNRFEAVEKIQRVYAGVVVLKGAGTLIAAEEENEARQYLISAGNPGMATAGMGDVLSGVIGGLMAQGLNPIAAARLGVAVHGAAADVLAEKHGERGMLATDLLPAIRSLVNP